MVEQPLLEYQRFVDALVRLSPSVLAQRVRDGVWHPEPPPDQKKYNELLESLSPSQRELVAEIVQSARESGIHDALVYYTDGDYRLVRKGVELAHEPYGTEVYFDYIARVEGDEWPEGDDW